MLVEPAGLELFFNAGRVLALGVGRAMHPHQLTVEGVARVFAEKILPAQVKARALALADARRGRAGSGGCLRADREPAGDAGGGRATNSRGLEAAYRTVWRRWCGQDSEADSPDMGDESAARSPVPLVDRVRALHPSWDIRLWTDAEMLAFVTEHGPQYLTRYISYKYMIQRCDFFRLFVVSVLGGVYLDLDVQLVKSFNGLPDNVEAFFPCERVMSRAALALHGNRDALRIGNYAFGAVPQHPFFRYLLGRLKDAERTEKSEARDHDYVLETTGPGILTTAYHDYLEQNPARNVTILYPEITASSACACGSYGGVAACMVGSYGNHLHVGSWR